MSKKIKMFFFALCFFRRFSKRGGPTKKKTGARAARIMQILEELAYYSFCTTANQPPTNAWHRKVIREPMCIFKTFARQCAALSAPSIFLVRGRAAHATCCEQHERDDCRRSWHLLAAYATLLSKADHFRNEYWGCFRSCCRGAKMAHPITQQFAAAGLRKQAGRRARTRHTRRI